MKKLYTHITTSKIALQVLSLLVISILFCGCYGNRSIMLKTPKDYPFAVYNDSLNNKETYKIAVADIITINVFTNEGRQRLGVIIDPLVSGQNANNLIQQQTMAYSVEPDSTIHVPILGRMKVVGFTIRQTEDMFKDMFSKYYNSPYIELKVTNKRFMVFIGGNNAKVVTMANEKTTLIEALALAGGIPPLSRANNIKLIRGSLANPTVYNIDLSTLEGAKLGGSMVIQANDIIYVEPVKRNFDQVLQQTLVYTSGLVGILAIVLTISRIGA